MARQRNSSSLAAEHEPFGQYLHRVRKDRHLTLVDLGEEVGRSASFLSRLERGERGLLSLPLLRDLARALAIDYAELVARTGQAVPTALPELRRYLADKYGLDAATADQLAIQFRTVLDEQGITEQLTRPNRRT